MKQILFFFSLLCLSLPCMAQNSLDDAIEDFKSAGNSLFTSAVERDPQTHAPLRVVKQLTLQGGQAQSIIKKFEQEAAKSSTEKKSIEHGSTNWMFVQEDKPGNTRIYSIEYQGEKRTVHKATLIIIIKLKIK